MSLPGEALPHDIEAYLLEHRGWVPAHELCQKFGIRQRKLRGLYGSPGLCSEFAISSDKGYRHVKYATDTEWERFAARMREHATGELKRRRRLQLKRAALLKPNVAPPTQKDGQTVFSMS